MRGQFTHILLGIHCQGDILCHCQGVKQGKMLEYHANTQLAGLRRTVDLYRLTIPKHFTFIGLDHTVDNFHEGTFTRAIFAKDGVYLPRHNREIDIFIGNNRGVNLADAAQFQTGGTRGAP